MLTFVALSSPVLRDTARLSQRYPPIARYGVFGVSTWPIGCDTPSPFSEHFPLGEHAKWRCDTPPQKGISAIPARYPMKTRQMGAIPPSAILSRKGIVRYGGVSRTGPLSCGIVLCDSAAVRIRIRIVRCQRPAKVAKRQKHKPCETKGRFFVCLTSPCS